MQINEIFSSIDGEGIRTGYLVTFIRSQFCSLKCSYCDTSYSLEACDSFGKKQYIDMTIEEILSKCEELKNKRITFTGGEPLIQKDAKDLISALTLKDYEVNVETNGNIDLKLIKRFDIKVPIAQSNLIVTMDWKSPSSGMRDKMLESNLQYLNHRDVLKFVVGSREDLDDMYQVLQSHHLNCHVFVSPIFGKIEPYKIVEYIKEHNLQTVRMQLQLHKIIWQPDERGV